MTTSVIEIEARFSALTKQRDDAQRNVIMLSGVNAVLNAEIDILKKQVSELKEQIEKLSADDALLSGG